MALAMTVALTVCLTQAPAPDPILDLDVKERGKGYTLVQLGTDLWYLLIYLLCLSASYFRFLTT